MPLRKGSDDDQGGIEKSRIVVTFGCKIQSGMKRRTTMKHDMRMLLGAGVVSVLIASAAYAGPTDDPGIQKREQNQEKRIDQGVKTGELTPREAGKLESQQAKIKQDEARMKSDGKLTKQERRKLTREQNRASKNIARKKHNERKTAVSQ
jgi:hypothetical protein